MQTQTMQREPQDMPFQVRLDWLADAPLITVNVDARNARKRVTGWAMGAIATSCGGSVPQLVLGPERVIWRVPVVFTKQGVGIVGEVGAVDVDAQTGEMKVSSAIAEAMLSRAVELARTNA